VAPGRAEAEAQFQKEMSGYRTEVQRMGDTISTMIADYQKQEATLSPTAKQTKQKEIRDKEDSYQKRTQELEQTAQQRQNELVRPIMEQINKLIAYVLDAGSAAGVVVAADKSLDITDKVIQRLKAAGPIAATPTPTVADTAKKPGVKSPPTSKPAGVSRPKSTTPPGAL
jgi:outer membrane protein